MRCGPRWSDACARAPRGRRVRRCARTFPPASGLSRNHGKRSSATGSAITPSRNSAGFTVSRSVKCEYCGNQRSEKARAQGLSEAQYDDLLNFETSARLGEREKAALAYAEAITWRLDSDDALWERLYQHFSEPELVELGCFIALTTGQQSWLRLLDIEHHEVLAGTAASMAPGFDTPQALAASKASQDYWARKAAT